MAVSAVVAMATLSQSQADEVRNVQLAFIDTNNCAVMQQAVQLLNSPNTPFVDAECSEYVPGGFPANNGKVYDYRLTTTVSVPAQLPPGSVVQLANIDTNDCEKMRANLLLLSNSSRGVTVNVVCSAYKPQGYPATNGRSYDYRLFTSLIVN